MNFCKTQLQVILATSKSDPYKNYEVNLRPLDSKYPRCNCIAFAMARNKARKGLTEKNVDVEAQCKHIKEVLKTACMWSGEDDMCPNCGSEVVGEGDPIDTGAFTPVKMEPQAPLTIGMAELRPMLAQEINVDKLPKYLEDDEWWVERKIDGHRILIHVINTPPDPNQPGVGGNSKILVLGRGGQASQHGGRFLQPHYKDIQRLPDCVIDGELVGDVLWVFDLPYCESKGITLDSPYACRRVALEAVFSGWNPNREAYQLLPTAKDSESKAKVAKEFLEAGGEGLMLKDIGGTYMPGGRVPTTLKAKFLKTADVIVTQVGTGGKENYVLSVYKDEQLIEIGACSAIGKTVVKVGDVIEVRFLNFAVNDRLYQPRMIKLRDDKSPKECLFSQFDHARVNKEVLA